MLDRTSAYAESGGQVADRGRIEAIGLAAELIHVYREDESIVHRVRLTNGDRDTLLSVGARGGLKVVVDPTHRFPTMRHHTATHLLHAALRQIRAAGRGALVYLRPESMGDGLIERLQSDDPSVREEANRKLAAMGKAAEPELLDRPQNRPLRLRRPGQARADPIGEPRQLPPGAGGDRLLGQEAGGDALGLRDAIGLRNARRRDRIRGQERHEQHGGHGRG